VGDKYSITPTASAPGIGIAGFVLSLVGVSLLGLILSWVGYAQAKEQQTPLYTTLTDVARSALI